MHRVCVSCETVDITVNVIFISKSASEVVRIKFEKIWHKRKKAAAAATTTATKKKISSLNLMTFSLPNCKTWLGNWQLEILCFT